MAYPALHPRREDEPPHQMSLSEFTRTWPAEGHYVEFKQGLPEHKVAEAVAAFSNADGGVIMLGVDSNGRPVGIDDSGELKARVHRVVARVHNPGRYRLDILTVGDKQVLVLAVDRRHDGFAQTPDGRVLIRREAQNATLVGSELSEFLARHSLVRFETQPTTIDLQKSSPVLRQQVANAWDWRNEDTLTDRLVEKGLATHEARRTVLTVAGSLYLLEDPSTDQHKYHIELFRYRDESTRYDKRQAIGGPLPEQVRRATHTVLDELGIDLVVIGTQRHEIPRLPPEVLREAISNAVAHRTYEDARRPVRIEVRPGRVVITSPGPLPEPVTVENIREQNAPRNVAIINTLRRFGLAEDAGRGVDVMEDAMAAHLLAAPKFVDDGTSVTVTLSTESTITSEERAWLLSLESDQSISPDERRLLLLAAREGSLTNARARTALGIDSVAARRLLTDLRDRGLLTQHGIRGGAQYTLARSLTPSPVRGLTPEELDTVILELAATGPITNEKARDATGADREIILRRLNALVESGGLVRHGERRGTVYSLAEPS